MGCTIVFVILLVIGMGIPLFSDGGYDGFYRPGCYFSHRAWSCRYSVSRLSVTAAAERGNPLSPTLRWMNAAGSILIAANWRTNFYRMAGFRYNDEPDRKAIQAMLWEYWEIQGHEGSYQRNARSD